MAAASALMRAHGIFRSAIASIPIAVLFWTMMSSERLAINVGIAVAIGAGIGAAIGAALGDIALGIAFGPTVALVVCLAIYGNRARGHSERNGDAND